MNSLKKMQFKIAITPYLFILPFMILLLTFGFIPAISGLFYSLLDWDVLTSQGFIGLDNFYSVLKDARIITSLLHTFVYVIITVPALILVSLTLAYLMVRKIWCKGIFRAIIYWPTMVSFIVVGFSFKWLFGEDFGLINYIITSLGGDAVNWMTNSFYATLTVMGATVWSRAGFYMVIYISGLQSIPTMYYEAAEIDGANKGQTFLKITMPNLKPTTVMVFILSIIDVFKMYPLVLSLTGGGPGRKTTFVVQTIYEFGFVKMDMGRASALSVILFAIVAVLTLIQFGATKGGRVE